jgi:hypothetical protein
MISHNSDEALRFNWAEVFGEHLGCLFRLRAVWSSRWKLKSP